MDEMDIEIELCKGTAPEVVRSIAKRLDSMLAFRPRVHNVGRSFHVNRAA